MVEKREATSAVRFSTSSSSDERSTVTIVSGGSRVAPVVASESLPSPPPHHHVHVHVHYETKSYWAKLRWNFGQLLRVLFKFAYNEEYRELFGRDSASWFKYSLYFCFFYLGLATLFCTWLWVWCRKMDALTPTYYNTESVMSFKVVNPGLGFRPQPNPESSLVLLNANDTEHMAHSLDVFLRRYRRLKDANFTVAPLGQQEQPSPLPVSFNYDDIIANTPCSRENRYGYASSTPCVALKLNRIYGWLPVASAQPPFALNRTQLSDKDTRSYIYVACQGQSALDKQLIGPLDYYSSLPSADIGGIHVKYFPYTNQPGYLSPLVFVHFKSLPRNTTVNVVCKAYAANIDNADQRNMRGMVIFQILVAQQ